MKKQTVPNKINQVKKEIPKIPNKTEDAKRLVSIVIVALMGSMAAYFLTAKLMLLFYNPDVEALIETAKRIVVVGGTQPEPVESFLFRLGVLLVPLFLFGFTWSLTKTKLSKIEWEKYFNGLSILFVVFGFASIYFGLATNNPNYVAEVMGNNFANSRDISHASNFKFYFAESLLGQNMIGYIVLFIPLIVGLLFLTKRFSKFFESKFMRNFGLILTLIYAAYYLVLIYQIFSFPFPYTWENKYDLNSIYYPSSQVYAGQPLLVDGFTCNYGLYAYFLNPVFKIIGLDIASFTSVMSILICLTLGLTLVAMLRTIKSRLLVILSFSSIVFLCVLLHRIATPFDAIFAMFPVRQLLPAMALCLASFYFFNKNRILYFISFILLSFGVLWNPEFGIVSFIAWSAALVYLECSSNDIKTIAFNIGKHILAAFASIALSFSIFMGSSYLQYHSMPNLMDLFDSMIYFGSLGAGALPMTLIHPWNFIILIYITGLGYAIYALFDKSMLTPKTAFIFLLSVMGIGLFTYFQARSHNWNLIFVISNALFLLAIYADMLLKKLKQNQFAFSYWATLILIISVLGFSCIDLISHHEVLEKLTKQNTEKLANLDETKQLEANIDFIKEQLPQTTEYIYIHTSNKYQALYFGGCLKKSAFNPSIVDIFTGENCTRLRNKMLSDSSDVFIEAPNFYYRYVQNTNVAMCVTRSVKATNSRMTYLKRRTYETPTQPILQETSKELLVYEKFTDDTASLGKRIDHALIGKQPVNPDSKFSIEVVFYAEKQTYQAATVYSNYTDSTGIELINGNMEDYYFLRWGQNTGVGLNLQQNRWHYLVMQTDGQILNVFLNGRLAYNFRLNKPIQASNKNFFVGGQGASGQQYFTGAISEILVKNGYSTLNEIQQRQQDLEKSLTK